MECILKIYNLKGRKAEGGKGLRLNRANIV